MINPQPIIDLMKLAYNSGNEDAISETLDALVDYIVYHQVTEDPEFRKALAEGYHR